jgi:hypothetical protein
MVKVIESRVWENSLTGRTASIYGAAPWVGPRPDGWSVVTRGWTWEMDNNTIGAGRVPAKTEAEAEAIMAEWNGRLDATARTCLPTMIEANRADVARYTAEVAEANYPAWKRAAKRRLSEAKARLAGCEDRLAALTAIAA